jgi:hypothetical protein
MTPMTTEIRHTLPHRLSEDRELLLGKSHRALSDDSGVVTGLFAGNVVSENAIAEDDEDEPTEDDIAAEEAELNKPRFRLWTFPAHISDPEAETLLTLFPSSISRGRKGKAQDVRFPFVRPGRGAKDLESGTDNGGWDTIILETQEVVKVPKMEMEDDEGVIRHGTGRIWAGPEARAPGWQGSAWFRFKRWWRRLFCMG